MGEIKTQGIQNTVITYIGIIIGFVNLIVVQPYFLSLEELGLTRVLFSFSALVATFIPLGIGSITLRYFPLFKNESGHHGFLGFILAFPVIGFLIFSFLLIVFKDFFIAQYIKESPLFVEYFNYVLPLTFILSLISVLNVYCFSLFKTTFPSLLNDVVIRVVYIILLGIYFAKLITFSFFIKCFVGVYGLQLIVIFFYIFRIDKPSLLVKKNIFYDKQHLTMIKYGSILMLSAFSSLGLKLIDTILIGKYLPLGFVAIYSIAAFIPTVIEAPLNSLLKIVSPKLAAAMTSNNWGVIKKIYYDSTRYLIVIGGILFIGININIKDLLSMLPADYMTGIEVVYILCVSAFVNMITGVNNSIIINSKYYLYGAFLQLMLLFISFGMNILLIPRYGIIGAAVSSFSSVLLFNLLNWGYIFYKFNLQPFRKMDIVTVTIMVFCLLVNFLLPELSSPYLNMIYRSIIITVIYATGIYYFQIIPEVKSIKFFKK